METLKIGTKVKVHGFIMLKGLNNGIYVISEKDNYSYTFKRPKGKKNICRHYISSIDSAINCFEKGYNNGIEILNN